MLKLPIMFCAESILYNIPNYRAKQPQAGFTKSLFIKLYQQSVLFTLKQKRTPFIEQTLFLSR